MSTQYTVWTVWELKTGEVALSGAVTGLSLSIGLEGAATTSAGNVKVAIVGIGVSDRSLRPADGQGILVKMLEGKAAFLQKGITLSFKN